MATSKYIATLRTNSGSPLQNAKVWIVPNGSTYPDGALALTEHSTILGRYYRTGVPDGEYDIWMDPAGGTSPSLYDSNLFHAEKRLSTIVNFVYTAFDTTAQKLKAIYINMTEVIAAIPDATTSVRGLLSAALKTAYDGAVALQHSHSNKDTLDTYTQTDANLADAVSKKHAHASLSVIEAIAANANSAGALSTAGMQDNAITKQKVNFITKGKNLFNKAAVTLDKYMSCLGVIGDSTAYLYSDYIPVTAGLQYSGNGSNHKIRFSCYFDANKSFVAGGFDGAGSTEQTTFTVPTGAAFIIITTYKTELNSFQFEQAAAPTAFAAYYEKFGIPGHDDNSIPSTAVQPITIDKILSASKGKNLFNGVLATTGYYCDTDGMKYANAAFSYSDFIPVTVGLVYYGTGGAHPMKKTCYYDANKNVVSGGGSEVYSFTVPSGVAYVIVTPYNSDIATFQFEQSATATAFEAYHDKFGVVGYDINSIPASAIKAEICGTELQQNADKTLSLKNNSIVIEKEAWVRPGKNLCDIAKATLNYYCDESGGKNASSTYFYTDFIPVIVGQTYTGWDGVYNMRKVCYYDVNKNVVSGGSSGGTTSFTVPSGVAFVIVSGYMAGIDTFQFENAAAATWFEPFGRAIEISVYNKKRISIGNSDKIIIIGDSYSESYYTLKGKAYISYLSMFSDWNFENLSKSGDDYADILARIVSDNPTYHPNYGISKLNGTYAVLMSFANDYNKSVINSTNLLENYILDLKKVIQAVKGLGMIPVICSEYHNVAGGSPNYADLVQTALSNVARTEGCLFFDVLEKTANMFTTRYAPFWASSHPGLRVNTLFWDSFKKYIDALPRPKQGIKIFRRRTSYTVSTVADLMFSTELERAIAYKELLVSQYALLDADNYYFDDLTVWDALSPHHSSQSVHEYLDLRAGSSIAFADYALVEVIVPTTAKWMKQFKLFLSDTSVTVYSRNAQTKVWDVMTNSNGVVQVTALGKYMNYDKISFLVYKNGGFSLNSVYAEWVGEERKDANYRQIPLLQDLSTAELLTVSKVDSLSSWTVTGSLTPADPADNVYPVGITKMVPLTTANYLSQTITFAADAYRKRKLQIKIWCRYFPSVFSSAGGNMTGSWTDEDKYDLGILDVRLIKNAQNTVFLTNYVALHWHEVMFEVDVPKNETSVTLSIRSGDSKAVQFCYASAKISG
jgi:hypothetical protein